MRRRFGRRRRNDEGRRALDVERELARLVETGTLPTQSLVPVSADEVASHVAAVGTGTASDGTPLVAAVSPTSGSAAWLAGLSVGVRLAQEEGFRGQVYAVSPRWSTGARALLRRTTALPFQLRAAVQPDAEGRVWVDPEVHESWAWATKGRSAGEAHATESEAVRAFDALQGLASKHGGVLQRDATGVRLVLLGRPVALLRVAGREVTIDVLAPRRTILRIEPGGLSEGLDQLEGMLRKFLSDRKLREGEEGLRATGAATLAEQLELAAWVRWPWGSGEACPLDVLGVDRGGALRVGALRRELDLANLAPIAEASALVAPFAAWWFGNLRGDSTPRLGIAAERAEASALRALTALNPAPQFFDVMADPRHGPTLRTRELPPLEVGTPRAQATPSPGPETRTWGSTEPVEAAAPTGPETPAEPAEARGEGAQADTEAEPKPRRFEEFSLFDLSEEADSRDDSGTARRRRRRRGGRGRSRTGGAGREDEGQGGRDEEETDEAEPAEGSSREEAPAPRRRRRRRRPRPLMVEEVADEEIDEDEETSPGVEAEGVEVAAREPEASGEGDEEEGDFEGLEEGAVLLEVEDEEPEAVVSDRRPEQARAPRRRAAIVAHADRDSIGAAVLLAREIRLLEGIWVYQQDELMTFFRSVATDLRDGAPIYLVGFTASPARETLQAASLYRDRLSWFDHHEWPPEDLEGLRQAIDPEAVHVVPGAGSVLPLVAEQCARRSRFSDKFLDLLTGRFSPHDYERWGRVWWWRLGEVAGRSGDRRADLQALITGRPSDLARDAAQVEAPPLPAEAEYVAGRDFSLVHFGGYTLVRVEAPEPLDLGLAARVARERYRAQISVARHLGSEQLLLGGEEAAGTRLGRLVDLGRMAEHLAAKFSWVETLPAGDHVARVRVSGAAQHPERVDELVTEIAMGRSLLEG